MKVHEINDLMIRGDFDRALEALNECRSEDQLDLLILKTKILRRKGELKNALKLSKQAIEESQNNGSDVQKLEAFIANAYVYNSLVDLPSIENAINKGKELLLKIKNGSEHEIRGYQASLAYLQGCLSHERGETEKALEYFEESLLIRQGLGNKHDIIETLVQIGWVHLHITGKRDLAFDYFERSRTISEELGNKADLGLSFNVLAVYYLETANFDKALSHFEKSLALYQETGNITRQSTLYNNIAIVYQAKEKYDLALDYYEKYLKVNKELGRQSHIAKGLGNIGWVHGHKGNFNRMIDFCQQSLDLNKEIGNTQGVSFQIVSLGEAYYLKGELTTALDYYDEWYEIQEKMESDLGLGWALAKKGFVYIIQGELEKALTHVNQALEIFNRLKIQPGIARCKVELGIINKLLGKYDIAIKYLEEGLSFIKKVLTGGYIPLWSSYVLFHLVLVTQSLGDPKIAKEYLSQIKKVQQESKSEVVKIRARFAEAIVLKLSKRGVEKFQAQSIFKEIVEQEILDFNITILSLLNLCELLILELKISDPSEDLFQEITSLSDKLYNIAQTQKSPLIAVMTLILQTKLALVRGDFEDANDLLSTAKRIASEKQLGNMLSMVKHEQEIVQAELDRWNELIQRGASIQERIEKAQIFSYITEAKKIQETWIRPSIDMVNQ